jgi:hypothetical protein
LSSWLRIEFKDFEGRHALASVVIWKCGRAAANRDGYNNAPDQQAHFEKRNDRH